MQPVPLPPRQLRPLPPGSLFGPLSESEHPVLGRPQLRPRPPGSLFGPLSLSEQPELQLRPLPGGSLFGPLSLSEQPLGPLRPQLRPLPTPSLLGPLSLSVQPLRPQLRPFPPGSELGPLSLSLQPLCRAPASSLTRRSAPPAATPPATRDMNERRLSFRVGFMALFPPSQPGGTHIQPRLGRRDKHA